MSDILTEDLLTITDAAKELPQRPHCSTLQRWRKRGIRGVKLEAALIGGRWFTSRQALRRFVRNATVAAVADHGDATITNASTPDNDDLTEQALDDAGL